MIKLGTAAARAVAAVTLAGALVACAGAEASGPDADVTRATRVNYGTSACPVPSDAAALRAGMLNAVNARRQAAGLAPLRPSAQLERAAAVIACDNSRRGQMTHDAVREGGLRARLNTEGYRFRRVSEALAHGHRVPDRLAALWHGSAYHYPTLMTATNRDTGIAVVLSPNGSPWWAMISAQPR